MRAIPLARCAFLTPFTDILDEAGAPTRSWLARFHLPTYPEEKPDRYMPLIPALRFATTAQETEGIADFGFHAAMRLSFAALSDSFRASVRHSPTLLAALQYWCRLARLEDTFLRFWLECHEDSLRLCSTSVIPAAGEMPHLEHSQWFYNMMLIYVVREFIGPDWTPANFAFQARYMPSIESRSYWPDTQFLSGQKASWIDVPISQLSLPKLARNESSSPSEQGFYPSGTDTVSSLKLMLASYLDERLPNIEETAEIVGTSVRSLQRELSSEGLTYRKLIDHVRFERSVEMLRETDAKVIDIASATGYTDASHFTRAFRRFAGVTPRGFRNQVRAYCLRHGGE